MTGIQSLAEMLAEMAVADELVRPSSFWEQLNDMNTQQLTQSGFASFKRTINSNYFQWMPTGLKDPQFRAVVIDWLKNPTVGVTKARLVDPNPFVETRFGDPLKSTKNRRRYALYVALLWEAVRRRVPEGLLDELLEPDLGSPLYVEHRGRLITQDLCNSALEYATIVGSFNPTTAGTTVMELGGGYGRLCWVFLSEIPDVRYVLVDIPPALAIAEEYLSRVLNTRRVFTFRRFSNYREIASDFNKAQIAFLTPNQLRLIPSVNADVFINVSSLHEMRPEQIDHYFEMIDYHCSGVFYSKQWARWVNPVDEIELKQSDYPVRSHWRTIFERRHPIQRRFFEGLYEVHPRN